MVRETRFEAFLADLGFGPGEGSCVFIVAGDEGIDVLPQLGDADEAASRSDCPPRMENQHTIWSSQEA